jgi:translation initiation factor IF-2
MPVRIYDIAKKLGIESRFVIARAKELGISTARVASSTLDKITAEYLEEQLGYKPAPAASETAPAPAAAPAAELPAAEALDPSPVVVPGAPSETAAPPEPPLPAVPAMETVPTGESGVVEATPSASAPAPAPVVAATPPAAPTLADAVVPPAEVVEPAPTPAPVTAAVAEPVVAPSQPAPEPGVSTIPVAPAAPVVAAIAGGVVSVVPPAPPIAPIAPVPVVPAGPSPAPTPTPGGSPAPVVLPPTPPVVAPAPVEPPKPVAPPEPPKPRIGEKVGFINLGPRIRPQERGAVKSPPPRPPQPGARPEPPRGRDRDGRPLAPGGRPAPYAGNRPGAPGMGPPRAGGRSGPATPEAPTGEEITLRPPIIVRDLADKMGKKPFQIIADLMELGIFATVNQSIESEIAQRVAAKHNFRFKVERRKEGGGVHAPLKRDEPLDLDDKPEQLKSRAPVVTIMGHVDHGKTTLLDVIRKSDVAAGEAGGITQHIGAYTIAVPHPEKPGEQQQITFLDTPGHAAFSAMRARGANVTDIVVLVVAANDGVMPQTLEALSHAQAARVPIIVAVNKCDHPTANPMMVRQQLQDKGVVPDDWGGDNIFVDCSALTKKGVDKLLGAIVVQADLLELKANPERQAKGNVVESGLEPGGPTATVLVRNGTLRVGDVLVCGEHYGRVRALINEDDKRLKEAGPSVAVKVLGLNGVPEAGIEFNVVDAEKVAREICEERRLASQGQEKEARPSRTLEGLLQQLKDEEAKVLKVVVKADTQGSVEAIVDALKKVDSDKVSLEIIHSAVGTVTETDVVLAHASKGVILGFHTRVDSSAAEQAKRVGVQIKLYAIIYELIDQVKEAMAGLLDPILKEVVFGAAEVRQIFALSKGGNVAGCVVNSGRIVRGKARVVRRRNTIYEGLIQTLRRFQDEVNEVRAGMECGIRLDGFDHCEVGDQIECYTIEKVAQKL